MIRIIENERELRKKLGCEDVDEAVIRDIFSSIEEQLGDKLERRDCDKKDCQCNKHLFIKIDEEDELKKCKSSEFLEKCTKLEDVYAPTGCCGAHDNFIRRWVTYYYPQVEYSYRFYECAICKKTFIGITVGQNENETILGFYMKEPKWDILDYLALEIQGILPPSPAYGYDLIDYEIIDFRDILGKMSLVHCDPNDYSGDEPFLPPPKLPFKRYDPAYYKHKFLYERSYNLLEIEEAEKDYKKWKEQEQLEQRDKEQLVEEINFILKNCQTIEEIMEGLNQLKREHIERYEQNENYKIMKRKINDFMKWLV